MSPDCFLIPESDPRVVDHLAAQARWIEALVQRARRYRILSTLPVRKLPFWHQAVSTTAPSTAGAVGRLADKAGLPDPGSMLHLLREAPHHQAVVLTGGERTDLVYAALAGLCPWIRTPHVITDAHWRKLPGLGGALQRLLLRLASRLVVEVQPHSAEELAIYEHAFGIPRDRLRAVPWSTSLIGYDLQPHLSASPFVLTGGHSYRDYETLLSACSQLGVTVKVGVPAPGVSQALRALVARHPTAELHEHWSNRSYLEQMAACTVFAMPITPGLERSTADQTILNAMRLGKTVVSSDSIGPRIYLRDGVNGFLVPEPRVETWSAVLRRALDLDLAERGRIGRQASAEALVNFNEPVRLARILDNVLARIDAGHVASWTLMRVRLQG